jgi:protoporphyrinogen oxidase
LEAISVLNINIGVDRPNINDQHWIYFPEGEFVFSRVGFPMNFSKSVAPAGTSSIYIEITHHPNQRPPLEEVYEKALAGLQRCGILRQSDRILTRNVIDIKYAYVVFNEHRQRYLGRITDYLDSLDIVTAGRYGRWDYFSMEDSILSGKQAAETIEAKTKASCVSLSST